jgi:transposase InsO family protein
MKSKSEVSSLFQQFHKMIATQYQSNIQVIRTDNGGEFINHSLKHYLNSHGIVHQTTCPYTPQQNGVVERKNRHLLEVVRASLFEANIPTSTGEKLSLLEPTSSTVYLLVLCNFKLLLRFFIALSMLLPCQIYLLKFLDV